MNSSCGRAVIERMTIGHIGHRGDGVADTPAGPVYVAYTLPGETVEVDAWPGHPDRRHLLRVDSPSAERIAPICPHFGVCGGCAVQHWAAERYRAWKHELVVTALRDAGIAAEVDPLVDAHGEGRRRATFHARRGAHGVLDVGFAARHAHHVVAIDRCPILAPGLDGAIKAAWAIAEALSPTGKPLDIQATATDGGLDVDVRGSGPVGPQQSLVLSRIADQHRLARLTRHGDLVSRRAAPTVRIGRATVTLPPGAFLQATAAGEAALASLVDAHLGKVKHVADLFCGVGPFSLRLAERCRVTAADSDAAAVDALRQAAASTSGLKPIAAECRDLFRRPFVAKELTGIDAVVFDPPRQGAQAQARELAASKVPLVIAVSCNPATFARDARLLIDGGFCIASVTPVDQFRWSSHVELVACLRRE
jgi:23S rRNA (uracil1939-C5)-methyltransferase